MATTYPYSNQPEQVYGTPIDAMGNATGVTQPVTSEPMLGRPPALTGGPRPLQSSPPMLNPRQMLWGGILMDIGNYIGSAGQRPMQGLGPQMMLQAEQQNYQRQQYAQATEEDKRRFEMESALELIGDPATTPAAVREWQYYDSLPDEKKPEYLRMKRSNPSIVDRQGLGIGYTDPVSGQWVSLVGEDDVAGAGAARQGAETAATQAQTMLPELINSYQGLQPLQKRLQEYERLRQSGELETGPIRGRIAQYFDPNVAQLRTDNIRQTLAQLGVQNLAPVSNFEIGLLSSMFADPSSTDAQLEAQLDLAINESLNNERVMKSLIDHIQRYGTLQGYDYEEPFRDTRETAPDVQGLTFD